MVNEWIGEGNIGTDLKLRHTRDSARPVLNMILYIDNTYTSKKTAVDSDHVIKKRLIKVPLIAWHKKAEEYYEAFQKGDRVRVKGSIRTRLSYKDDFSYPSFEIVVSDLILLNRKNLASMF